MIIDRFVKIVSFPENCNCWFCRWTMQKMPQRKEEYLKWKKRTQKNYGKNIRCGFRDVMRNCYVYVKDASKQI